MPLLQLQAKKAELAAAAPPKGNGEKAANLMDDSNEEQDPSQYYENRVKAIKAKQAKGINPYPHKFDVTSSLPDFVAKYKSLEAGQQLDDVVVSIAGALCNALRTILLRGQMTQMLVLFGLRVDGPYLNTSSPMQAM